MTWKEQTNHLEIKFESFAFPFYSVPFEWNAILFLAENVLCQRSTTTEHFEKKVFESGFKSAPERHQPLNFQVTYILVESVLLNVSLSLEEGCHEYQVKNMLWYISYHFSKPENLDLVSVEMKSLEIMLIIFFAAETVCSTSDSFIRHWRWKLCQCCIFSIIDHSEHLCSCFCNS